MGEERRFGTGRLVLDVPGPTRDWVHPSLALEPASIALRVAARRLSAGTVYLITNESDSWVEAAPRIPAPSTAKMCDPETGTVSKAPRQLRLAPWGSTVFLWTRDPRARHPLNLTSRAPFRSKAAGRSGALRAP